MKLIAKSFIPYTILLAGILFGVWYFDRLASEKSQAFIQKTVKGEEPEFPGSIALAANE